LLQTAIVTRLHHCIVPLQGNSSELCCVFLRRRDLSDEILQEVYVRIWEHASSYDSDRASPITWMVTIARNRTLDEVRKRDLATVDGTKEIDEVADPMPLAPDLIQASEEWVRLQQCLDALEEQRGEAIRLAYLFGLSRQDLAAHFDQPVGTIKTWLYRGVRQLRECLDS
jgi:RNA polymerase sigma-70 factor (ECF subfamily)